MAAERVDVLPAGLATFGVRDVVVELEVVVDLAALDCTGALLGADGGGERGGDRAAERHDAGDVGALITSALTIASDERRRAVLTGTGPAPSISQISPGRVCPRQ